MFFAQKILIRRKVSALLELLCHLISIGLFEEQLYYFQISVPPPTPLTHHSSGLHKSVQRKQSEPSF